MGRTRHNGVKATMLPRVESVLTCWKCCRTAEYDIVRDLHTGDKIWSYFYVNEAVDKWHDPWALTPGPAGRAAGRRRDKGRVDVTFRK
jgi:hypothetical protein